MSCTLMIASLTPILDLEPTPAEKRSKFIAKHNLTLRDPDQRHSMGLQDVLSILLRYLFWELDAGICKLAL